MNDEVMRERLQKTFRESRVRDSDNKKKNSKEKLRLNLEKKIRTTMIGLIDKIEKYFGEDWGHGLKEEECSDNQLDKYEIWQQCRQEMLDLGNKQIRASSSELDLYDVEFKGYQYHFNAREKQ